jgi:hypothetical protein
VHVVLFILWWLTILSFGKIHHHSDMFNVQVLITDANQMDFVQLDGKIGHAYRTTSLGFRRVTTSKCLQWLSFHLTNCGSIYRLYGRWSTATVFAQFKGIFAHIWLLLTQNLQLSKVRLYINKRMSVYQLPIRVIFILHAKQKTYINIKWLWFKFPLNLHH